MNIIKLMVCRNMDHQIFNLRTFEWGDIFFLYCPWTIVYSWYITSADLFLVFVGHNGAGKSTTINMLTGLLSATEGNVM